jgi:hypothetical protein
MHRRTAPLIDIVRMEEKESKLKSFVQSVVEKSVGVEIASRRDDAVLLVARSPESPVAKAVAALAREGIIGQPVRAVFALAPRGEVPATVAQTLTVLSSDAMHVLIDARLFDAHEQLVLSETASWVGDCMRRDPMKRDAYECFAADCAKTASWARRSHERLWELSEAMQTHAFAETACLRAELVAASGAQTDNDASADPASGSSG